MDPRSSGDLLAPSPGDTFTPGLGDSPALSLAPFPGTHPAALAGPPVDWRALHRVLVVRLDNLGDVVLTGPLIRVVRAALGPGARLDLLASPGGAQLAPLLPGLDDVLVERVSWQDANGSLTHDPQRELALAERMRGYDAVVISTSFSQSPWPAAYAAYLAGVPVRIGQSREFGGSLLTHWVLPAVDDEVAHQVDRSLRMIAAAGVPFDGSALELELPKTGAPVSEPYVLLAPGASAPSRRYPRFRAVTNLLRGEGLRVLVVGPEKERDLLVEVSGGVDALVGELDVPGLAGAVAAADLVVTNNSGCLHLADAYRVPSVVLFAGTESLSQYAPRAGAATVLSRPVPCSPCRSFACPYAQECLDVPPEQVVGAVLARLGRIAIGGLAKRDKRRKRQADGGRPTVARGESEAAA
ncbi:MAG TPA: glycosyltransferase family 9 protein [Frankiaceae bacterium]|nr:glycosyltransferase family 9 protein [Frankiaceae bacterium]